MRSLDSSLDGAYQYFSVHLDSGDDREYRVRGRFGKGTMPRASIVLLVPGATYGYHYWDMPYRPDIYSLVRWLNRAGYDTLALDRIGIGGSDKPQAGRVTVPTNSFVLHEIVQQIRQRWDRVHVVGHSLGSLVAILEAATHQDVDALVVTGILHNEDAAARLIDHFYPAAEDARFADSPPPDGYITSRPGGRLAFFYRQDMVETDILNLDELTKETVTSAEVETIELARLPAVSKAVSIPVLTMIGEWDMTISTERLDAEDRMIVEECTFYSSAPTFDIEMIPGTGHNLCLHRTAPMHHGLILDWLAAVS